MTPRTKDQRREDQQDADIAAAIVSAKEAREGIEQDAVEREFDSRRITVPCWATALMVQESDGQWIATVVGDAYGVGQAKLTSCHGPTPRAAVNNVADVAEGWTTFALVNPGEEVQP